MCCDPRFFLPETQLGADAHSWAYWPNDFCPMTKYLVFGLGAKPWPCLGSLGSATSNPRPPPPFTLSLFKFKASFTQLPLKTMSTTRSEGRACWSCWCGILLQAVVIARPLVLGTFESARASIAQAEIRTPLLTIHASRASSCTIVRRESCTD